MKEIRNSFFFSPEMAIPFFKLVNSSKERINSPKYAFSRKLFSYT